MPYLDDALAAARRLRRPSVVAAVGRLLAMANDERAEAVLTEALADRQAWELEGIARCTRDVGRADLLQGLVGELRGLTAGPARALVAVPVLASAGAFDDALALAFRVRLTNETSLLPVALLAHAAGGNRSVVARALDGAIASVREVENRRRMLPMHEIALACIEVEDEPRLEVAVDALIELRQHGRPLPPRFAFALAFAGRDGHLQAALNRLHHEERAPYELAAAHAVFEAKRRRLGQRAHDDDAGAHLERAARRALADVLAADEEKRPALCIDVARAFFLIRDERGARDVLGIAARAAAQTELTFPSANTDAEAIRAVYRRAMDLLKLARVYAEEGAADDDTAELVARVRALVQREHARLVDAVKAHGDLGPGAWPTLTLTVELAAGVGRALYTSGQRDAAAELLASSLSLLCRADGDRPCEDLWQRLRWGAKPLRRYRSF